MSSAMMRLERTGRGGVLAWIRKRCRRVPLRAVTEESRGRPRLSSWDRAMVALAGAHAAVLVAFPYPPLIAVGLWWNSNTISHNFIHRPFFRRRPLNLAFSAFLSLLLAIPQSIWRQRHLAHHAGVRWRLSVDRQVVVEVALVVALWSIMAALAPVFFFTAYAPAYLAGLGLCWLHGYYEHARDATSYYGRLYNLVFFNDGYHIEHHANPGEHWTRLPRLTAPGNQTSSWPAPFRWLEAAVGPPAFRPRADRRPSLKPVNGETVVDWRAFSLEGLERLVLRSGLLRRFVLGAHRRAMAPLVRRLPAVAHAGIVGGGLFPRTALLLRELAPAARITIIDASRPNLAIARRWLGPDADYLHARYPSDLEGDFDLLVIPLAFAGDRGAIYRAPPAPAVLVHDWIWRRHGVSRVVSTLLLKRLNLIVR